jgi:hypothetical protein
MANMNLLVPGTGGITLMNQLGEDLGYPVKMALGVLSDGLLGLSADELVALLSMDHRPGQLAPAKTSLAPGVSIRPGHALQVAYNQVPASFNHFLYDWRADIHRRRSRRGGRHAVAWTGTRGTRRDHAQHRCPVRLAFLRQPRPRQRPPRVGRFSLHAVQRSGAAMNVRVAWNFPTAVGAHRASNARA